jgi:polyhydroxybutyrate depolymerase
MARRARMRERCSQIGGLLLTCAVVAVVIGGAAPTPAVAAAPDAASPGCGLTSPFAAGVSEDTTLPADPVISGGETERAYRVHLPVRYTPDRAVPLVLAFHGYTGTDAGMEAMSGLSTLADEQGFVAVYPQGVSDYTRQPFWASVGRGDYGVDDVRFVGDLLDALERTYCIDPARIYATGFSNGGAMVGRLACRLSDRIAAFAPVSGNFIEPDEGCRPSRPVPILEIHGTADRVVSYYGVPESINPRWPLPSILQWLRGWAARDGCAPEPTTFLDDGAVTGLAWPGCAGGGAVIHYRLEGGGHEWPTQIGGRSTAGLLWDFFLAHPLPGAAP